VDFISQENPNKVIMNGGAFNKLSALRTRTNNNETNITVVVTSMAIWPVPVSISPIKVPGIPEDMVKHDSSLIPNMVNKVTGKHDP
jgi:hypothetical protein